MANNVTLPGTGAVVSTRETADSEHIQQVQLDIGTGTDESPVCATNPLPVTGPLTDTELRAEGVPVKIVDDSDSPNSSTYPLYTTGSGGQFPIAFKEQDGEVFTVRSVTDEADGGLPISVRGALGRTDMAGSLPVAIASDQGDVPAKIKFDDGWGGGTVVSGSTPLPTVIMNSSIVVTSSEIPISVLGGGRSIVPTLDTNPYADGDVLWATPATILPIVSNASVIRSVVIIDNDDNGGALDLWFTSSSTSWGSANSAPSPSDETAQGIIGKLSIAEADYYDLGGCKVAYKECAIPLYNSNTVYCVGISRGTKTYSASGLYIKIFNLAL